MAASKFMPILWLFTVCCLYHIEECNARYGQQYRTAQLGGSAYLPRVVTVQDFEYIPTRQGYKYGYKLSDGTSRHAVGIIANPYSMEGRLLQTGIFAPRRYQMGSDNTDDTDSSRSSSRRGNLKNRKLSPGSLKSLAG